MTQDHNKEKYGGNEAKDFVQAVQRKARIRDQGEKVVKLIVAIERGYFCEQYEKLDGDYYANFIPRTLEKCYKRAESVRQNYSYKIIARSKIVQSS